MKNQLDKLLLNFKNAATGAHTASKGASFTTYAVTNFRGGIGKSTLAFNLA